MVIHSRSRLRQVEVVVATYVWDVDVSIDGDAMSDDAEEHEDGDDAPLRSALLTFLLNQSILL